MAKCMATSGAAYQWSLVPNAAACCWATLHTNVRTNVGHRVGWDMEAEEAAISPLLRTSPMLFSHNLVLHQSVTFPLHQGWITTTWSGSIMVIHICHFRDAGVTQSGTRWEWNGGRIITLLKWGLCCYPRIFQGETNLEHFQKSRLFQERSLWKTHGRANIKCLLSRRIWKMNFSSYLSTHLIGASE